MVYREDLDLLADIFGEEESGEDVDMVSTKNADEDQESLDKTQEELKGGEYGGTVSTNAHTEDSSIQEILEDEDSDADFLGIMTHGRAEGGRENNGPESYFTQETQDEVHNEDSGDQDIGREYSDESYDGDYESTYESTDVGTYEDESSNGSSQSEFVPLFGRSNESSIYGSNESPIVEDSNEDESSIYMEDSFEEDDYDSNESSIYNLGDYSKNGGAGAEVEVLLEENSSESKEEDPGEEAEYLEESESFREVPLDNSGRDIGNFIDDLYDDVERKESLALEVPGMEDVIVTPDGRSLAEMLPGMRRGFRTTDSYIDEITDKANVVKIGKREFTDTRYTKGAKSIQEDIDYNEDRKRLAKEFLQKYNNYTEQEKIIAKNLGVTQGNLQKLMGSGALSDAEKARLLEDGRRGPEKYFKGVRYRSTLGDRTFIEFLSKFKYANTSVLRWIMNESQGRAWRKLNRLRENGLAKDVSVVGIADLWTLTQAGAELAGDGLKPGFEKAPNMMTIAPTLGVNYLAACLWYNTVNVLNLDDFPAYNRKHTSKEELLRGEELVSEYEIRSSLGKEINPNSTTMRDRGDRKIYDVVGDNVRRAFDRWEHGGRQGASPEFATGNEYMWVLYPRSAMTATNHVPDLVVRRERGPNGEPRSIAVELERYSKKNHQYRKIMLAYKLDKNLYEKVIWVTPNTRVARQLKQAAEEVGFEDYDIVPIISETGIVNTEDMWLI